MVITLFVMTSVGSSTRGLESSLEVALESVLQRTFIHLISTIIESHNGDDATKDSSFT
jgi:hypothetical protein